MQNFTCPTGCCDIYIKYNISMRFPYFNYKRNRRKAGVFIYDSKNNKVLLIQSNGRLWGPPKGTVNYGETDRQCAIREVREETGLEITDHHFTRAVNIQNKAVYFYLEKCKCPIKIPDDISENDATGITWIKPECLEQCIVNGNIKLSQHCRIVFEKFLKKIFPVSSFILVK